MFDTMGTDRKRKVLSQSNLIKERQYQMKKLHELSLDELKALYEKNGDFQNEILESIYQGNMYCQSDEYEQIFGKNNRTVEYHDHYNSFYLTVKDHENFINEINDPDLLTVDGLELYKKAKELSDKWANMTYDEQDENSDLYDELEETNNKLIEEITDQLRTYEDIDKSQIEQELQVIADNMSGMGDWETDGEKVYQTVVKVYK